MDAYQISDFVNAAWQGVYITRKVSFSPALSDLDDRCQLWETLLYGPDGPSVFTLEFPSGYLKDVTR
jgi:hypothetical protein